jgi:hypothetical protein
MSKEEEAQTPIKSSIINYVENFIEKRNSEVRASADDLSNTVAANPVDRDSIVIKTGDSDYHEGDLVSIL